jgi:hypothetical protein
VHNTITAATLLILPVHFFAAHGHAIDQQENLLEVDLFVSPEFDSAVFSD